MTKGGAMSSLSIDKRIELFRKALSAPDVFISVDPDYTGCVLADFRVEKAVKFSDPNSSNYYVFTESEANEMLEDDEDHEARDWPQTPVTLIVGEP